MNERVPKHVGDPLIDEVRAIRRAILEEHGNDLRKLVDHLREIERQHVDRLVNPADLARPMRDHGKLPR